MARLHLLVKKANSESPFILKGSYYTSSEALWLNMLRVCLQGMYVLGTLWNSPVALVTVYALLLFIDRLTGGTRKFAL